MNEKMEQPKNRKTKQYTITICLLLACGGLLFGYDNSGISGAIGFITNHFSFSASQQGWVVSSIDLGAIIGSIISGPLSNKYGRKKILILSSLLFIIGSIGQGAADNLLMIIVPRLIGGMAIGVANSVTPIFISELAPAKIRGALNATYQLVIVTGITLVYFVNAYIADLGSYSWNVDTGWRLMLFVGAIPAIIFLIASAFVPESPRWLISVKKDNKALKIMRKIRYADEIKGEVNAIKGSIDEEKNLTNVSLTTLFKPEFRKIVGIGFVLAALQHLTGIDAITYYAPEILKKAGLGTQASLYNAIIVGLSMFMFTLVAIFTVDKFGRKKLLIIGSIIMTSSLFAIGILFSLSTPPVLWILIFIVLNLAGFSIGMGSVMWVVLGEIFPTKIRSLAMSVSMIALWLANFIVAQFFPVIINSWGTNVAFYIFAVFALISILFTWKYIPETKNKTLEQIQTEIMG